MSDLNGTVEGYFAMWNEEDPIKRAGLIERTWVQNGRYVDPLLESAGHAGISEMVAGVHSQFPGHRFRRVSGIDSHHDQVRFGWELRAPDGSITVAGIDIGETAPDGRLQRITGFFGGVPEAAPA